MANSGIQWIDEWFNLAVRALYDVASWLGITYEEINVWLFMVAWPVVTLALMGIVVWQSRQNRQLRRDTEDIRAGIK